MCSAPFPRAQWQRNNSRDSCIVSIPAAPPPTPLVRQPGLAMAMTQSGPWQDVVPGRLVRPGRSGRYRAANVMTFFQELMLSVAIATFAVGLGNLIRSALAAVW